MERGGNSLIFMTSPPRLRDKSFLPCIRDKSVLSALMAMAVHGKNRHYRWKEICIRHWLETAKQCGFGEMKTIIQDVIARTPVTIQQVRAIVPVGFPA